MNYNNKDTIYFVGYARLSERTPVKKQFDRIAVGIEVDMLTGQIVDSSVTIPTELGKNIVYSCIVGKNVNEDAEEIVTSIKRRFQGEAQSAIVVAFKNALEKHKVFKIN